MRALKVTQKRFREIIALIEAGDTIQAACKKTGIGRSTFYRFLDSNRDKRDTLKKAEEIRDRATGDLAIEAVKAAFLNDWRSAAWWLERSYPEQFSLRTEFRVKEAPKSLSGDEIAKKVATNDHYAFGILASLVESRPKDWILEMMKEL